RQDRPDVEAAREHGAQLVPGLEHLPAVDALQDEPLEMTWFMSRATSPGGMPRMATRPPWFIEPRSARSAAALPLISMPTSKPSVIPSSFMVASMETFDTLMAREAPIFLASSSR